MAGRQPNKNDLSRLESLDRLMNLPIVETGWNYAGQVYGRLKQSNNVLYWACGQVESSFSLALNRTLPVAVLFKGPISTLDKLLCHSLDTVEGKVPSIHLPPEEIYSHTKQYINEVSTTIIRPILKRADSVKQMGNNVLESKYTVFAADKLDGALSVADKYVDKYLPADALDNENEETDECKPAQDNNLRIAYKTMHHMDRFSKKLQRRLTRRTLAEAKALKEHSTEAINILVYALEVIATDPKLAHQKAHEIWASLSSDEPENQARPENLEELVVMLTRESARRFVHFVNFAHTTANAFPKTLVTVTRGCRQMIDSLMRDTRKNVQLGNLNQVIFKEARTHAHKFTLLLHQLNLYTTELLEQVAKSLEEQEQNYKTLPQTSNQVQTSAKYKTYTTTKTAYYRSSNKHNNVVNGSDNKHT